MLDTNTILILCECTKSSVVLSVTYIHTTCLSADPTHSRAQGNMAYFEPLIQSDPNKYINSDEMARPWETPGDTGKEYVTERERYESLCRAPWPLVSPHHD